MNFRINLLSSDKEKRQLNFGKDCESVVQFGKHFYLTNSYSSGL